MRGLRLLRAPAALLACLCVLLLGGTPAYAHTALKDATPAPGSKVGTGTSVMELTFLRLKPGTMPKISLTGPDGTAVPVGQPVVAGGSVACATVSPLQAGVTTLTYTVTATDNDVQTNSYQFEVADAAQAVTSASACQGLSLPAPATGVGTGASGGGMILGLDRGTALAVAAVAGVVIVGGGLFAARGRRGARPTGRRRATG